MNIFISFEQLISYDRSRLRVNNVNSNILSSVAHIHYDERFEQAMIIFCNANETFTRAPKCMNFLKNFLRIINYALKRNKCVDRVSLIAVRVDM